MHPTNSTIQVANIGKEYTLGALVGSGSTLYDVLARFLRISSTRQPGPTPGVAKSFWALKDVSFDLVRGEVLGILGRNGAGKSTLLKILTRITSPTTGLIRIRGRVASLLEVGTGFHPELTGRENIFLNGAILGMTRRDIAGRFDEIVDFAGVEEFLETPVKRYSSGMYVRLAFAVAAHLEPDVLIVDEVLAVGDAEFQEKCLAKMGQVRGEGRTVLFVSHNMTAIQALCSRALWLERGQVVSDGTPKNVVSAYLTHGSTQTSRSHWNDPACAPGNALVRIRSVSIEPASSASTSRIDRETPFKIAVEFWNQVENAKLHISLQLVNEQGQIVFNTVPAQEPNWQGKRMPRGLFRSTCDIPALLLNSGNYRVGVYVVRDQSTVIFGDDRALAFRVHDVPEPGLAWHGDWTGAIRPRLLWETELLSTSVSTAPIND